MKIYKVPSSCKGMVVGFLVFLFLLPFFLVGALLFVFWILMLVDAASRKFKNDTDKVVWILVIILTGLIGALIYYFVVYYKDEKKSMKWFWITLLVLFIILIVLLVLMGLFFYVGTSTVAYG